MNIKFIFISMFLFNSACSADNTQDRHSVVIAKNNQSSCNVSISEKFKSKIFEHGFSIHAPIEIETSKLIDNMWQLDNFFEVKNSDIFSYTSLSKYKLTNSKNKLSASLYCFYFDNQKLATKWFNVFNKTKLRGQLRISFNRPKKVLVLNGNNVIFVEGYRMSDFEALKFIVTNLDGEKSLLNPDSK